MSCTTSTTLMTGMLRQCICILVLTVASVATGANATLEQESMVWQLVEESGELTLEEKEQLYTLLLQNADLFATSQYDLGHTGQLSHTITINQVNPVRQKVQRIPPHCRQEVKELLAKMQENDLIRPFCSPWASPVVLLQKADGSLRLCVGYRNLNEVTTKDAYPLPRIDNSLNTLAGSQWFSTLDLASDYWQVEVAEQDRENTAFCTSEDLFEFNVMPFGLCNAPATFQRLMDLILAGLSWSQCLVYIDDLMVLGDTFTSHLKILQAVFQRIRKANQKLQPRKCSLLRSKVNFLSHKMGCQQIRGKLRRWLTGKNLPQVRKSSGSLALPATIDSL